MLLLQNEEQCFSNTEGRSEMILTIENETIRVAAWYLKNGQWEECRKDGPVALTCRQQEGFVSYHIRLSSKEPTKVRLIVRPEEEKIGKTAFADSASGRDKRAFHVIPCCIYGDNNAAAVQAGEFPLLCEKKEGEKQDIFRSPRWEFRADRAAMPLSALCLEDGTLAVTVDPYIETEHGTVCNGLFAELPDRCGVTFGYTNDPMTFINKRTPGETKGDWVREGELEGRIYFVPAKDKANPRLSLHEIIRREYALRHERPVYQKTFREAVEGCLTSFVQISWNPESGEYTNCNCLPPENPVLHPWRNVKEIGWTGGGVLAYPLILAENILGEKASGLLSKAASGGQLFSKIAESWNEDSGLLYDLTSPIDTDAVKDRYNKASGLAHTEVTAANEKGRRVNGWWAEFGLAKDVHCAYTVGTAVHELLKAIDFRRRAGRTYPESWLESARKTVDTVIALQREDGAFGYTYHTDCKKVADWNGFAGCWFVPCCAYLYHMTKENKYLEAADRGLAYYGDAVRSLTCNGTPMDTWKSPDEEGNLAYIRGARLLHEYTGEERYLEALKQGADYEFLWRYGYRTRPMYKPIADGWNSCGGSITSVSNPHIHPMGMLVDSDLYYLGRVSKDPYYTERALDGTAWMMQTLELYPEKTGYGQYGVLSERWCPSDGLLIQKDSDGNSYSSWYSYNLWAAAAAFEEACERCLDGTELSMR